MNSQKNAFSPLDLAMLPPSSNTLVYNNEFIVDDNLDLPYNATDATPFINVSFPFKINFTMFILCLRGRMRVNISLKELEISANDALICFSGSIGQCQEITPDCKLIFVAFTVPVGGKIASFSCVSLLRKQCVLHLSADEMQETLFIYSQMRKKMAQQGYEFVRNALLGYMQVLLCNVCHNVLQMSYKSPEQPEERSHVIFDRFIELVQQHYVQEREIRYYAELMCMTPKYLSRVVYQASGRYAGEWIRDYVILEAKALLKSGLYNVQQVSIRLNFTSASFFGKYFKKAVGCSPRKYAIE